MVLGRVAFALSPQGTVRPHASVPSCTGRPFSLCTLAAFMESLTPASPQLAACMGLWVTMEVTWS